LDHIKFYDGTVPLQRHLSAYHWSIPYVIILLYDLMYNSTRYAVLKCGIGTPLIFFILTNAQNNF